MVSVDNDILGVFFNGVPITDNTIVHDNCPVEDDSSLPVPQQLIKSGPNLVAFQVLDRGGESFFDARILAELP
jgi:hypothetical protein